MRLATVWKRFHRCHPKPFCATEAHSWWEDCDCPWLLNFWYSVLPMLLCYPKAQLWYKLLRSVDAPLRTTRGSPSPAEQRLPWSLSRGVYARELSSDSRNPNGGTSNSQGRDTKSDSVQLSMERQRASSARCLAGKHAPGLVERRAMRATRL